MNSLPTPVSRRAALAGGALVLALALAAATQTPDFAGALGWYAEPTCDDAEAQNPGDPAGCRYEARESKLDGVGGLAACADGVDNDSDERTDCDDEDCFGEDGCGRGEWCNVESAANAGLEGDCGGDEGASRCADGVDNDSDGLGDCADPDCAYGQGTWSSACVAAEDPRCEEYTCNAGGAGKDEAVCGGSCAAERCGNGADDDGDGSADCEDATCAIQDACQNRWQGEGDYALCSDGVDNDGDGAYDCDDGDCAGTGACWWSETSWNPANWWGALEQCGNGSDDDGDGQYDCADPDCSSDSTCAASYSPYSYAAETSPWGYYDEYYCRNGADDDGDGHGDCDDGDCADAPSCAPRPCSPTETDGDGNCETDNPYWGSSCSDGWDNDSDGLGDCSDGDCAGDASCQREEPTPEEAAEQPAYEPVARPAYSEVSPDGYEVAWGWGNGYCVDGLDNDGNGQTDCWDKACDGADPACDVFEGEGTQGWPTRY